ncbi:BaiN/RdsA family NAD(P)/FAD-dependent oxidoreductase [Aminipila terrae]|uniref:Aminoacetone oxidase family FAD-binding enzyme n=1 Tax=Aminipila terrae TaxID=2697030 RepID=A0A6P1MGL6_9FIRM|nr:NAD(P)/FAD-dependent oxidoreductase [Aminipila terrae]QHI73192.1 aminoacetone oxidase family FAD-binding enzyme [Aminipila terrae]
MADKNIYDVIIVGGGASGLFCAASYGRPVKGLILEQSDSGGKKLLMSGSGQCNITHSGDIKEFIKYYGENGKKIRSILYRFNNKSVVDFFESRGVPLLEREDGKVFPKSLDAKDILNILKASGSQNGFQINYKQKVCKIEISDGKYVVICEDLKDKKQVKYTALKLVIAAGGCSYPSTGSDGSIFPVLEELGIQIIKLKPALAPVYVQEYPYTQLSGISFSPASVKVNRRENQDALLLTHTGFSGPAVINISRYVHTGDQLVINYFPGKSFEEIFSEIKQNVPKSSKQTVNFLIEYLGTAISKRFIEKVCERAGIESSRKVSSLTGGQIKSLAELLTRDTFSVSGTGGFNGAMVTAGGVALTEVDLKTMECRKYPGLFFVGEVLDVDGDTGGYNLQFAWSSGYLAANVSY